jgi:hypothetical protein
MILRGDALRAPALFCGSASNIVATIREHSSAAGRRGEAEGTPVRDGISGRRTSPRSKVLAGRGVTAEGMQG